MHPWPLALLVMCLHMRTHFLIKSKFKRNTGDNYTNFMHCSNPECSQEEQNAFPQPVLLFAVKPEAAQLQDQKAAPNACALIFSEGFIKFFSGDLLLIMNSAPVYLLRHNTNMSVSFPNQSKLVFYESGRTQQTCSLHLPTRCRTHLMVNSNRLFQY